MKILITILLALFLSSTAYSNESAFETINDLCENLQSRVLNISNVIETRDSAPDSLHDFRLKDAKLFHYMDCRTLLKEK